MATLATTLAREPRGGEGRVLGQAVPELGQDGQPWWQGEPTPDPGLACTGTRVGSQGRGRPRPAPGPPIRPGAPLANLVAARPVTASSRETERRAADVPATLAPDRPYCNEASGGEPLGVNPKVNKAGSGIKIPARSDGDVFLRHSDSPLSTASICSPLHFLEQHSWKAFGTGSTYHRSHTQLLQKYFPQFQQRVLGQPAYHGTTFFGADRNRLRIDPLRRSDLPISPPPRHHRGV